MTTQINLQCPADLRKLRDRVEKIRDLSDIEFIGSDPDCIIERFDYINDEVKSLRSPDFLMGSLSRALIRAEMAQARAF